jgi:hypothetical protein
VEAAFDPVWRGFARQLSGPRLTVPLWRVFFRSARTLGRQKDFFCLVGLDDVGEGSKHADVREPRHPPNAEAGRRVYTLPDCQSQRPGIRGQPDMVTRWSDF